MEETPEMMEAIFQAFQTGDKGTERIDSFIKRNCDFCDFVTSEYKGKNVLIVTHALNTRVINYYFNGKPKDYDFRKRVVDSGRVIIFGN